MPHGVNAKDNKYPACVDSVKRHLSSKCLAARKPCSSTCGCKGCKNPHGNRVMLGKRKREVHLWQTYDTASTSISLDRGQTLTDGGWSTLESIILIQVICFLEHELMDLETATILMVYNTTVEYALAPYCSLAVPHNALLRRKTFSQVQAKFEHSVKESSLFFKLHC